MKLIERIILLTVFVIIALLCAWGAYLTIAWPGGGFQNLSFTEWFQFFLLLIPLITVIYIFIKTFKKSL